jgi:hypothetical protein
MTVKSILSRFISLATLNINVIIVFAITRHTSEMGGLSHFLFFHSTVAYLVKKTFD